MKNVNLNGQNRTGDKAHEIESFLLHQPQQGKYATDIWFENVELSSEN